MLTRHLVAICCALLPITPAQAAKAPAPSVPMKKILADVAAAKFAVPKVGWTAKAPWRCQQKKRDRLCTPAKRFWRASLTKRFENKDWHLTLWAVAFDSVLDANAWVKRHNRANESVFGKTPVSTFSCGATVIATEGVFRGPTPHRMLDKAVAAAVTRHCP